MDPIITLSISSAILNLIDKIAKKANIAEHIVVAKNEFRPILSASISKNFTINPIKKAAIASLKEPLNKNTKPKAPRAEHNIVTLLEYLFHYLFLEAFP